MYGEFHPNGKKEWGWYVNALEILLKRTKLEKSLASDKNKLEYAKAAKNIELVLKNARDQLEKVYYSDANQGSPLTAELMEKTGLTSKPTSAPKLKSKPKAKAKAKPKAKAKAKPKAKAKAKARPKAKPKAVDASSATIEENMGASVSNVINTLEQVGGQEENIVSDIPSPGVSVSKKQDAPQTTSKLTRKPRKARVVNKAKVDKSSGSEDTSDSQLANSIRLLAESVRVMTVKLESSRRTEESLIMAIEGMADVIASPKMGMDGESAGPSRRNRRRQQRGRNRKEREPIIVSSEVIPYESMGGYGNGDSEEGPDDGPQSTHLPSVSQAEPVTGGAVEPYYNTMEWGDFFEEIIKRWMEMNREHWERFIGFLDDKETRLIGFLNDEEKEEDTLNQQRNAKDEQGGTIKKPKFLTDDTDDDDDEDEKKKSIVKMVAKAAALLSVLAVKEGYDSVRKYGEDDDSLIETAAKFSLGAFAGLVDFITIGFFKKESIEEGIYKFGEDMTAWITGIKESVESIISGTLDGIIGVWTGIIDWTENVIGTIKNAMTAIMDRITGVWDAVKERYNEITSFSVGDAYDYVAEGVSGLFDGFGGAETATATVTETPIQNEMSGFSMPGLEASGMSLPKEKLMPRNRTYDAPINAIESNAFKNQASQLMAISAGSNITNNTNNITNNYGSTGTAPSMRMNHLQGNDSRPMPGL